MKKMPCVSDLAVAATACRVAWNMSKPVKPLAIIAVSCEEEVGDR